MVNFYTFYNSMQCRWIAVRTYRTLTTMVYSSVKKEPSGEGLGRKSHLSKLIVLFINLIHGNGIFDWCSVVTACQLFDWEGKSNVQFWKFQFGFWRISSVIMRMSHELRAEHLQTIKMYSQNICSQFKHLLGILLIDPGKANQVHYANKHLHSSFQEQLLCVF